MESSECLTHGGLIALKALVFVKVTTTPQHKKKWRLMPICAETQQKVCVAGAGESDRNTVSQRAGAMCLCDGGV